MTRTGSWNSWSYYANARFRTSRKIDFIENGSRRVVSEVDFVELQSRRSDQLDFGELERHLCFFLHWLKDRSVCLCSNTSRLVTDCAKLFKLARRFDKREATYNFSRNLILLWTSEARLALKRNLSMNSCTWALSCCWASHSRCWFLAFSLRVRTKFS